MLVARGHDAVHAVAEGLAQASDGDILLRAADQQRVVITADLDYPRILALTHSSANGLILFRGGNFNEQDCLRRLQRVAETVDHSELPNLLVVVEPHRIRRRRLPIS